MVGAAGSVCREAGEPDGIEAARKTRTSLRVAALGANAGGVAGLSLANPSAAPTVEALEGLAGSLADRVEATEDRDQPSSPETPGLTGNHLE